MGNSYHLKPSERAYLKEVYEKIVVGHDSEFYSSPLQEGTLEPYEIAKKSLESVSDQLRMFYDVLSGNAKSFDTNGRDDRQ